MGNHSVNFFYTGVYVFVCEHLRVDIVAAVLVGFSVLLKIILISGDTVCENIHRVSGFCLLWVWLSKMASAKGL